MYWQHVPPLTVRPTRRRKLSESNLKTFHGGIGKDAFTQSSDVHHSLNFVVAIDRNWKKYSCQNSNPSSLAGWRASAWSTWNKRFPRFLFTATMRIVARVSVFTSSTSRPIPRHVNDYRGSLSASTCSPTGMRKKKEVYGSHIRQGGDLRLRDRDPSQ